MLDFVLVNGTDRWLKGRREIPSYEAISLGSQRGMGLRLRFEDEMKGICAAFLNTHQQETSSQF
jgi:hypothetical protein